MLRKILSVVGRPGLYKLLAQNKANIIVEQVGENKRLPIRSNEQVLSLNDIAMYVDTEDGQGEVRLRYILAAAFRLYNGENSPINPKKASTDELAKAFSEVLPEYDRDSVYPSDIKKFFQWYNLLLKGNVLNEETIAAIEKEMSEEEETEENSDNEQ
ncbi:MAG TPA: DUF5606 domain-containing protein [Bacteroidaceae bacterium]|nr:DUF5606 domain-containing protein [Bacteroidaceae bacterium]